MKVKTPHGVVSFPDGTDPETINQVLSQEFGSQPSGPTPIPSPAPPDDIAAIRGIGETGMQLGSGIIAQPVAGLVGAGVTLANGPQAGAQAVQDVAGAMTYQPRSGEGQYLSGAISKPFAWLDEQVTDFSYKSSGGNPAVATAIKTAIEGAPMLLSFLKFRGAKGRANRTTRALAPDVDDLKSYSRQYYKQLENSTYTIPQAQYNGLVGTLRSKLDDLGFHPDIHPKVNAALKSMEKNTARSLAELERNRRVLNSARMSGGDEARIASALLDELDNTVTGWNPVNAVGATARELWRRGKKVEILEDALANAAEYKSGFQSGLKSQLNRITKRGSKLGKYFTEDELQAMRRVAKGGFIENLSKQAGKFGFKLTDGTAGNVVGGTFGVVGAGALLGPEAAFVMQIGTTASRWLSNYLTRSNSKLLPAIVGAGGDPRKILKAYFQHVPSSKWNNRDIAAMMLTGDTSKISTAIQAASTGRQMSLVNSAIGLLSGSKSAEQSQSKTEYPPLNINDFSLGNLYR